MRRVGGLSCAARGCSKPHGKGRWQGRVLDAERGGTDLRVGAAASECEGGSSPSDSPEVIAISSDDVGDSSPPAEGGSGCPPFPTQGLVRRTSERNAKDKAP